MIEEERIPLAKNQIEILREFYEIPHTRVIFNKKERDAIWKSLKAGGKMPAIELENRCPALRAEIEKSLNGPNLIQSAVFSECVYAQTLANMFGLDKFFNYSNAPESLDKATISLLDSYHLKPRYVYKTESGERVLIQAGGNAGVDSALVTVQDNNIFTIEFKEPGAKTSEPDLPAYGEDGNFVISDSFLVQYPQFAEMIREQLEKKLNFWEVAGSNVNDFSMESIQKAVSENYASKKFADVICVEDENGFLAMLPANQVSKWSEIVGEIRPAGRNAYSVWTPNALIRFIENAGGRVIEGEVVIPQNKMQTATQRGGDGAISRFKLKSIFFVRVKHAKSVGGEVYFNLDKVSQLKPTIAAKMFFKKLLVSEVHEYYAPEF